MINKKMYSLGASRSVIRELFEYGKQLKQEIGEDKVYDFTLGNPSVPCPKEVDEYASWLILNEPSTHAYTSANGDLQTRKAIAHYNKEKYGFSLNENLIYMTCGAAASLKIVLSSILSESDEEILAIAPFFPEYRVFTETSGGVFKYVSCDEVNFSINLAEFEKSITPKTRGVIINSPNNPAGTVYSEEIIKAISKILDDKQKEYGYPIYIIADEPYREISYGKEVPYIPAIYDNTIVCYSFSKSLSLPGERIGYIAVSPKAYDSQNVYFAIMGAGRALGYVCAPSLFQRVIADNLFAVAAVELYQKNRDALCDGLKKLGYTFIESDGAFYLLLKAPDGNGKKLSDLAKKHNIIMPSGESFGAPEYVRISYCVSYDTIINSMPAFKTLLEEYK